MPSKATPATRITAFLSYARKDAAIVGLLKAGLEPEGIRCALDSGMAVGRDFRHEIRRLIHDCDVVIVALTERSSKSAWVNQEIGFGLALGRPVCVIDLDSCRGTIDPAMAATLNISWFDDWSKPKENFREFVGKIKQRLAEDKTNERRDSDLRHVIEGQVPRTTFIIGRLAEFLQSQSEEEILIQAAFSSLSISNHPMYLESEAPGYVQLLQRERELLERLIKKKTSTLKMIVWPFRRFASDPRYLPQSLRTLFRWMKDNRSTPNVRFACGEFRGPNRMIVTTNAAKLSSFVIEGYKHEFTAGHNLSIVNYQRSAVESVRGSFSDLWADLAVKQHDNERAIQELLDETGRRYPDLAHGEFAAEV
jgi:hypothetical protein